MLSAENFQAPILGQNLSSGIEAINVHPDIAVAQSGRTLGNTDRRFGDYLTVADRRMALARRVGARSLIVMVPVIGSGIINLDRAQSFDRDDFSLLPEDMRPGSGVEYDPDHRHSVVELPADAFFTQDTNVGLMLGGADCAAAGMYDPVNGVLGLAHIGREGASRRVGPKLLRDMQSAHGTSPEKVIVHFGPSISPCSHVVEKRKSPLDEVVWTPFIDETDKGYEVDIVSYAKAQLLGEGVEEENMDSSEVDTATEPEFFSYTEHRSSRQPDGTFTVEDGRNGFVVAICGPQLEMKVAI